MKPPSPWLLFGLTAAVQLGAVAWLIGRWELTLSHGAPVKFECAPIDPYDPFRGRYVALNLKEDQVDVPKGSGLEPGDRVFVLLGADEKGFATFKTAQKKRPVEGIYLDCRLGHRMGNTGGPSEETFLVRLPFNRFFLNERIAPEAERAYGEATRDQTKSAWLETRVWRGQAVPRELYLDGIPVDEAVGRGQ